MLTQYFRQKDIINSFIFHIKSVNLYSSFIYIFLQNLSEISHKMVRASFDHFSLHFLISVLFLLMSLEVGCFHSNYSSPHGQIFSQMLREKKKNISDQRDVCFCDCLAIVLYLHATWLLLQWFYWLIQYLFWLHTQHHVKLPDHHVHISI